MTSYPYLDSLFKNVLAKSKAIEGRMHICPNFGTEINSDNLGEIIEEFPTVSPDPSKKYPLALLMPPRSRGLFSIKMGEWESYRIVMAFLKTTYYDSANQVSNPNTNTGTSQHTIPMDWHDMKRSAVNFIRALDKVQRHFNLISTTFRLDSGEKMIDPISTVGKDRVSGVRLEFAVSLNIGCDLEDYIATDLNSITMPELDSHPEHKL